MDFTGTALTLRRNIYPQTGDYSFNILCSVDNTTGEYSFGLSGNGNSIDFIMRSGKLYFNNTILHSYRSNQEFSISADFTNNKINVRKDDFALLYGQQKSTGFFDYFYFKRQNSQIGASFDLDISGDNIPSYEITNNGYLVASGQNAVTGYFINNSLFPIRVFDSNIESSEPYSFGKLLGYVQQMGTGNFIYSGDFDSIDFSQPIFTTFNTTFGDSNILFKITDLRAMAGFVLLDSISDFSFSSGTSLNRDISYTNYSGGFATTGFNTNLVFVLDYVSGSGSFIGYDKSFTGAWNFQTGINSSSLFSLPIISNLEGTRISGGGTFQPNSLVNFQLNHINSGTNTDVATLTISGQLVYNPISTTISVENT